MKESAQDKLKEWLSVIIGGMVSRPEAVKLESVVDEMGHFFVLSVHPEDRGRIIGKDGQHATALRTLLRCAGSAFDVRASLKIDIPDKKFN